MKVVSALQKLCEHCYIVRRGKRIYLRCKASPRHKRRQGFSTINFQAQQVSEGNTRSYDGYRMDMNNNNMPALSEDDSETETPSTFNEMLTGQSQCSHCAKPLIYDMSARIQARQDYMAMMEAEDENEK